MADKVELVPLDDIDDGAVPRERTGLDGAAFEELKTSILLSGLRMPVELCPIEGGGRFGIVSGYRRVTAFRALREMGIGRFEAIPAFVRPARGLAETLAAMVEENAVRADLSPWEQGRIALVARDLGAYATIEAAVEGLYPAAEKSKRSRLRALARLVEGFDGVMAAPERLSWRQALRLADAVRDGYGEAMAVALEQAGLKDPETQWALLAPYLDEAEKFRAEKVGAAPSAAGGGRRRPIRLARPRAGLVIRREMTPDGWRLHFTGREARSALMDRVIEEIEHLLGPA